MISFLDAGLLRPYESFLYAFGCECARVCITDGPGLSSSSLSGVRSRSLVNGDLARLTSFFAPRDRERVREFRLPLDIDADCGSSSIDVAAVVEEVREKRPILLPAVLPVSVELRESVVRERR